MPLTVHESIILLIQAGYRDAVIHLSDEPDQTDDTIQLTPQIDLQVGSDRNGPYYIANVHALEPDDDYWVIFGAIHRHPLTAAADAVGIARNHGIAFPA